MSSCPYCGKAGNLYSYQELIDDVVYRYTYCGNCYVRGPRVPCGDGYRDGDETRAWNTMCGGCKPVVEEKKIGDMYEITITGNVVVSKEAIKSVFEHINPTGYENIDVKVRMV